MKTMFNRFAIIPCMCSDCREYIWLEKYRKTDCWENFAGCFLNKKICKDCILKYNFPTKQKEMI